MIFKANSYICNSDIIDCGVMVTFYEITDWEKHEYLGTGGTRDKEVVENPDDHRLYYFKTSLKKGDKDYTYEFWSEVIASEIGNFLGFDVLKYNVAANGPQLGCLSKLMIDTTVERLDEGYKWLIRHQRSYNTEDREAYTFQLIDDTLKTIFPDKRFTENLISTIVLDCIIGNEDRHQENWGIIVTNTIARPPRNSFLKKPQVQTSSYKFAPIYDSGSSLGRELSDGKVNQILQDSVQLEAYINRGKSEIHWHGERGKQKHFALIDKIANAEYREAVVSEINRIRRKYDRDAITSIIQSIDDCLPQEYHLHKIPQNRKDLLVKLITLRIERLLSLRYE